MFKGFKEFISRGNMIDMAVGVVMGSAVTAVVNAIVKDLINPLISMFFGKPNMDNILNFTFNHATISFGGIFSALLNFLIMAAAIYFFIVVPINKFRDVSKVIVNKMGLVETQEDKKDEAKSDKQPEPAEADPRTIELLGRIADNLDAINRKTTITSRPVSPQS
ncbi:large conductance mechanosensitive channel protein MscL [Bifidobacterium bombi]|uniref:Large-conductance mechanosensitive channel n=1 Tax=Bifidobacterium bombi DSM 19703 TaxID=1341695 RepID=A0A086BPG9_9BIFI|nr:large conductance mechanosensitive channel protein MscL [Bifidobacterium bombi]KFF31833.1 large-conductance mechanosensitive channel [Bifidobacterium bombi DSM 19703]